MNDVLCNGIPLWTLNRMPPHFQKYSLTEIQANVGNQFQWPGQPCWIPAVVGICPSPSKTCVFIMVSVLCTFDSIHSISCVYKYLNRTNLCEPIQSGSSFVAEIGLFFSFIKGANVSRVRGRGRNIRLHRLSKSNKVFVF